MILADFLLPVFPYPEPADKNETDLQHYSTITKIVNIYRNPLDSNNRTMKLNVENVHLLRFIPY